MLGPRGTGKSTWLRDFYHFSTCTWFNLLDEALYQELLANPALFGGKLKTLADGTTVVIDEVQRLPNLLNEVHRFIEEKHLQFVLCGSSARKIKKIGTNLLAGRALRKHMHPFIPEELGALFDFDQAMQFGTLPVILGRENKREALEAYVQTYLKEEIQAEALVRNLPGFARFLPVAALFHGQVINVSSLGRDAGVSASTVAGYIEILEDTLMAFRLPAFEGRLRVREKKHPKLYWIDPGVVRALKRTFSKPAPEELGHLFEGWVASVLAAYRDYRRTFDQWYYWAPAEANETEVDFLLESEGRFVAIEVKAAIRFSKNLCKGLEAIQSLKGIKRRILVYRGEMQLRTDSGIEVMPFGDFLNFLSQGDIF